MSASSPISCPLAGRCSGCGWIELPYEEQLRRKDLRARSLWREQGLDAAALEDLNVASVMPSGLRDRVDLILDRAENGMPRVGLFDRDHAEILSLGDCPAMSPALLAWYHDFCADLPPIRRGSLRLRVSADGRRGVWLDFANIDVKELLTEGEWLRRLASRATVEIGQRRKRLREKEGGLGLAAPELESWMPTYCSGKMTPLYTAVAAFTQVGHAANRALVASLEATLPPITGAWIELGAGCGNFTLPLAAAGAMVTAVEHDELALAGLSWAATEAGLAARIAQRAMSFQNPSPEIAALLRGAEGILADPPRSGLLSFPDRLAELPLAERPRYFVYVSCFAESLVADAKRLSFLGYRLKKATGLDIFPQTPHAEWIFRFERE